MRTIIGVLLLAIGAPVSAQSSPYQGSPSPTLPAAPTAPDAQTYILFGRDPAQTPTMRREKRDQALALRSEALQLQAHDGGVLSAEHIRYVQRKSRKILGISRMYTGTLTDRPSATAVRSCLPYNRGETASPGC